MGKYKNVIIIAIIIVLVAGYYFYLSNKEKEQEETQVTAVQEVILRNLDTNYPPTVKEVVKYYSEISKCLYNEKYSNEQFEQMADKLLAIYDDELAANNPREQYLKDLKKEVEIFAKNQYNIVTYTPSASTEVDYYTVKGRECASIYCSYSIKKGAEYVTSVQVFVLRKDASTGRWKILGFDIPETNNESVESK